MKNRKALVLVHVLGQYFDRGFVKGLFEILDVRMTKGIAQWIISPHVHVSIDDERREARRGMSLIARVQCLSFGAGSVSVPLTDVRRTSR